MEQVHINYLSIHINYVSIVIAIVANFIFGFIWYTALVGKCWGRELGMNMTQKPKPAEMTRVMVFMVIGSFLLVWVFAHNIAAWSFVPEMKNNSIFTNAMMAATFTWLGFFLPVDLSAVAWERKSWTLFFINTGYHLISLIIVALILTFMAIGGTQLNHGTSNPYTVSGQSFNLQAANNDYLGVMADRSSKYQFNFLYNYITSNIISGGGGAGYMLQFGTEGPTPGYSWNLNGMVVSGNYLNWTGGVQSPPVEPHGIFAGAYNADVKITYNYLNQVPLAFIEKSDGSRYNSTNRLTSGGICYNIVYNPQACGIAIKGMANTNVYNNTFYQPVIPKSGIIHIFDNTGTNGVSSGTHIYNNIFYSTSTSTLNIRLETTDCQTGFISDYNVFYCTTGTPMFQIADSTYTFSQWQSFGYDTHSVVVDPNFLDFTNFIPSAPLYYGTNLGPAWQTGLAVNAAWGTSAMPATANQGSAWQVGARIFLKVVH